MQFAIPLDLHWTGRPRSIAAALLRAKNFTALLDPGPSSTLPRLRQLLQQHGLRIADLQAIFLTHIHLDHAAATGSLVRENPGLRVYVHGKGAPHLIDPAKLLESAGRLFGADRHRLFGDFLPVPKENLEILQGGEVLAAGSRELQVFYTPGHASHHVTYFEPQDGVAYVGDVTGISVQGDAFVLPAMPPPDVSMELWDASLDLIERLQARKLFLTHFAFSEQVPQHLATFRKRLHLWSEIALEIAQQQLTSEQASLIFSDRVSEEAARFLSQEQLAHYLFNGALPLSWLGLQRYHRNKSAAAK